MQIINDNNFVQLNKYYDFYNNMDRRQLENAILRNIILGNKKFENIQNKIAKDIYNRLINRKKRVLEEDLTMRITMVNKLCKVDSKEDLDNILKGIKPFLRNKRRVVFSDGRKL